MCATLAVTVAGAAAAEPLLFWIDDGAGRINSLQLGQDDVPAIVANDLAIPYGLAVDPAGKIYWVDLGNAVIHRANFDGSVRETLPIAGSAHPGAIAIDPRSDTVYWTDVEHGEIWRSGFTLGTPQIIIARLGLPAGLALDTLANRIYWSDAQQHRIRRANLNGRAQEDIAIKGLSNPVAIALDAQSGMMYWSDVGADCIHRSSLNGTEVETLVVTGLVSVQGLALDVVNGLMYWSDLGTGLIQRANLDGTAIETVVHVERPLGIALAVPTGDGIIASTPAAEAIDARQPSDLTGRRRVGWSSITLMLGAPPANIATGDIVLSSEPEGFAPDVVAIELSGNALTVQFDSAIPAGAWTYVTYLPTRDQLRIAHLPGDVDGDGTVSPLDVLALLDHLNGTRALPPHATDIDRSENINPMDVLRLLDVLNGADGFEPWNGRSLPE